MKHIFTLLFLAVLGNLSAQSKYGVTLSGYVTIQNSGNQSAYPTQIKSIGATDAIVNSNDGSFKLIYPNKMPGMEVNLYVEKTGYEVVNEEILDDLIIPDPSDLRKDVKIYLCKEGEWRKRANEFYEINQKEIYKTYQKQIKELEKKKKEALIANDDYERALEEYKKQKKLAEAQAHNLSNRFAKANLDDASDRYKKSYRLFSEGKIDSVLIVLNEEILLADLKRIQDEINEANTLINEGDSLIANGEKLKDLSLQQLKILAQTYAEKEDWEEANRFYLLAVDKDDKSLNSINEHITFLYSNSFKSQGVFDKLGACEKLLSYIDFAIEKKEDDWIENASQWHEFASKLIPFHSNKNILEIELDRQKRSFGNY